MFKRCLKYMRNTLDIGDIHFRTCRMNNIEPSKTCSCADIVPSPHKIDPHCNTTGVTNIHSIILKTQRNNLLMASYWSTCLYRTKEKKENIASLTSALSHQLQSHIARKQRYTAKLKERKNQQVCQ